MSCKSCKDAWSKQKSSSCRVVRMAWSVVSLSESKEEKRSISNLKWHCLVWDCLNLFLHGPRALLLRWAVFACGSSPQINSPLSLFSLLQSTVASGLSVPANCCCAQSWEKPPTGQIVPKWRAEMACWFTTAAQLVSTACFALRAQLQARFWDNCKWQTCHSWFARRWLTSLFLFSLLQNGVWPSILGLMAKYLVCVFPFKRSVRNRFHWGQPCRQGPHNH